MTTRITSGRRLFQVCFLFFCLIPLLATGQETLPRTPADYEGPFYPIHRQADEDNDLVHVADHSQSARGETLLLSGVVLNAGGQPVQNGTVEIWQTDPNGLYKDQRDSSPGKRDPDFQYWGKARTGPDGSFSFTTLVPGKYEPRPAHIHCKIWIDGRDVLTSQIYFRNHPRETKIGTTVKTNDLQTVDLVRNPAGGFKAYFQIVL